MTTTAFTRAGFRPHVATAVLLRERTDEQPLFDLTGLKTVVVVFAASQAILPIE